MPGSLGIEAILEAVQLFALAQGLGLHLEAPHFGQAIEHEIVWKYRGQILQDNKKMYLEVHISQVTQTEQAVTIIGDASLWKDGMRIYEVKELAIHLES